MQIVFNEVPNTGLTTEAIISGKKMGGFFRVFSVPIPNPDLNLYFEHRVHLGREGCVRETTYKSREESMW
jgi:hypothetical protein